MAATNYTPIQLYRTNTASGTAPAAGNLSAGELAINYNDGGMILFAKNTTGNVIKLMNNPANLLYPTTDGSSGQAITTNGSGTLSFGSFPTASANNAFTGANTFYNATGQTFAPAATNDGIIIQGRAGGSSTYRVTFATATLSANRTLTFPDATDTAAVLGTAQTFTAAQTFRAANAIRSEAASTQDAVVIAGRAGGSSSYAVTLTPATLSSSTTLTLPNITSTVAVLGTAQTFTAAQTFRAASAIRSEAASTQDAVVIAGRAGGSSSYAVTLTPTTLSASRTLTLPDSDETLGYLNVPQNVQTGSYTLVLADAGKQIYRASGGAETWTIPANSSVAYPIGTALTFINLSATSVSIAITTDTMYLSSAGTTGTRTLGQYGSATAIKIESTTWIISGSGLT
jgi:hypothetical protein